MRTFLCCAILFDMDGVLVDSTPSVSYQWLAWARENQIPAEIMLPIIHGRRTVEVIQIAAPHLDAEAEAKKIEQRGAKDNDRVSVVPGAAELLNSLPQDRWAVVTSATRHVAQSRLAYFNLPAPRVLVTADDVLKGKPDPEPYLKGARLVGVDPVECLVVEDAPAGIRSAHAGGMRVIGIASTFAAEELRDADAVVASLGEIRVGREGDKLLVEV
jgi:mannitol-1-/sugar-/sorbitol-6-phosphatase